MKYRLLLFMNLLFIAFLFVETKIPIRLEKGISLELAKYRKQQVSNVVYHLDFDIPTTKTEPIPASLTLTLIIQGFNKRFIFRF